MSGTLRLRARVGVPVEAAYAALTDVTALRTWLAEHAEVDLPDRYAFWGRTTPDGDAPHQKPLRVDDRSVSLQWTVYGQETTVELGVEPSEDGTVISLAQSDVPDWSEAAASEQGLAVLLTFWSLAVGNLVEYLEGRTPTPKPDYTSDEQRAEVEIAATPGEVFTSLTDTDVASRWFGAHIGIEPHVGGRWAMGGLDAPGDHAKIVELEPDRRVTLGWPDGMVTTWELDGSAGRTRLTFVQSGFTEPPHASWTGWLGGIVELRRYLEIPDWRTIWLGLDVPGLPEDATTIGSI